MTRNVNSYTGGMGRWQAGTRERLERAALELFMEQGFAETTVPQITARAGLTTRTFFRYFADKREVLFGGEEVMPALVARLMTEAPVTLSPLMVIAWGFEQLADNVFEGRREELRLRRRVIQADAGLRERELQKRATLSEVISQGFSRRGSDRLTATLSAEIAVTVFSVSLARWLDQEAGGQLSGVMTQTLQALRAVAEDLPAPVKRADDDLKATGTQLCSSPASMQP